jgi:hypothetical protein
MWYENGPNDHKIYQNLPLQEHPKFTQIRIFGLKTNHLATLLSATVHKVVEEKKIGGEINSKFSFFGTKSWIFMWP